MKKHLYFLVILAITGIVSFISSCASYETKVTMVDASVPSAELSLIVVLGVNGSWTETMLVSINENKLNLPGSMFYIPSGVNTISFKTTRSSFEDSDFKFSKEKTEYVRTTYINSSELQITDNFLPRHTYRMIIKDSLDIRIEDITDSIEWLPPKVSIGTANNGVLTNYAEPRGFYVMPVLNTGLYLQYNHKFKGTIAKAAYHEFNYTRAEEKGVTGLNPVITGIFFQGGVDLGVDKLGLTLMAEINGGVGLGNGVEGFDTNPIGLNWGYLFVSELYYLNTIGVGFGYGKTNMVPSMSVFGNPRETYDYFFPYLRGELLFFPNSIVPITIYTNYFYDYNKWAFGVSANFSQKREKIFSSKVLR